MHWVAAVALGLVAVFAVILLPFFLFWAGMTADNGANAFTIIVIAFPLAVVGACIFGITKALSRQPSQGGGKD
jgi:uncharacterized membrane protein YphA (DoxX/SURF4 family)